MGCVLESPVTNVMEILVGDLPRGRLSRFRVSGFGNVRLHKMIRNVPWESVRSRVLAILVD